MKSNSFKINKITFLFHATRIESADAGAWQYDNKPKDVDKS